METQNKNTELSMFLESFIQLPELILNGMVNVSSDEDMKLGIMAYETPLKKQFRELSEFIMDFSQGESAQKVLEANQLVKVGSGKELVTSAMSVSKNLRSIFSKLSLSSIVREIKKLIFFLLDLFKAPKWIYKILLIIDQILNAIFGWDLPEEMPEVFSRLERNFYQELTEHNKFIQSLDKR